MAVIGTNPVAPIYEFLGRGREENISLAQNTALIVSIVEGHLAGSSARSAAELAPMAALLIQELQHRPGQIIGVGEKLQVSAVSCTLTEDGTYFSDWSHPRLYLPQIREGNLCLLATRFPPRASNQMEVAVSELPWELAMNPKFRW